MTVSPTQQQSATFGGDGPAVKLGPNLAML
jgi:hypothetical protein